jgi:ELWxxDGT repeat protein
MAPSWWRRGSQHKSASRRPRRIAFEPFLEALEERALLSVTLVKDINTTPLSSFPAKLVDVNGRLFFTAASSGGNFLWRSDGTAAGTVALWPNGGPTEHDAFYLRELTPVNGTLFFINSWPAPRGYFQAAGSELWKTDGTPAGTVLVKGIAGEPGPSPNGQSTTFQADDNPVTGDGSPVLLTGLNGTLFFAARGPHGGSLWRSNGTEAGTWVLAAVGAIQEMTVAGGQLFFTTADPGRGPELWRSDGTAPGTRVIKVFNPGPVSGPGVAHLTGVGGTLFFNPPDAGHGDELWRSDGTAAGTARVQYVDPGSHVADLIAVGGTLFVRTDGGPRGPGLFKSDGTAAGTVLIRRTLHPIPAAGGPTALGVGDKLFFVADDRVHGPELWVSDGTAAGTALVKDIHPGPAGSQPGYLTDLRGTLLFTADDGVHGAELWKSDGTAAGTVLVKDIFPGPTGSAPAFLTAVQGRVFFAATDPVAGTELWQSDGTAGGTRLVKDLWPENLGSNPGPGVNVNGTFFFSADDGIHGNELWKTDGTAAGTVMVKDIYPGTTPGLGPNSSRPSNLTQVNGTLLFTAITGGSGPELWRSDGTALGTYRLLLLGSQDDPVLTLGETALINGTFFFLAFGPAHETELWKTDGTAQGTVRVQELRPATEPANPVQLFTFHTTLFLLVQNGLRGVVLWASDGTARGTVRLKEFAPGPEGSNPVQLFTFRDTAFLLVQEAGPDFGDYGLWTSDGTVRGTTRVADLNPGPGSWSAAPVDVHGTLLVTFDVGPYNSGYYNDAGQAPQLWASDGTAAGTRRVKTFAAGSSLQSATVFPWGLLLDFGEQELWKSDGTAAGTIRLWAGNGAATSYIGSLATGPDTMYFVTSVVGQSHATLWKSDGTIKGTVPIPDPLTGDGLWNGPASLAVSNGALFFTEPDLHGGLGLWRYEVTAGARPLKDMPGVSLGFGSFTPVITVPGTTYFIAPTAAGWQMWSSDGTPAGTGLVAGVPVFRYSEFQFLLQDGSGQPLAINGVYYFSADDGTHGSELWKMDLKA